MSTIIDNLAKPIVIEPISHDAIVSRQAEAFKALWSSLRAANPDLPAYDVAMLETDPAMIGNQAESAREVLLRQRINDAAISRLLAYASGSDLDHLAVFYDVSRLLGEDDDRLKLRVILAIQGRSTGGTEERYRYIALTADLRVADAKIYTLGRSPLIHVALYSTAADGIASAELISIVNAALQADGVRMVNDTIMVASAVRRVIDLVADIWLLPDADAATLDRAEANLRGAWSAVRALGRDLTTNWWQAQLMVAGVYKVAPVSPVDDEIAASSEALSIGTVSLRLQGRSY